MKRSTFLAGLASLLAAPFPSGGGASSEISDSSRTARFAVPVTTQFRRVPSVVKTRIINPCGLRQARSTITEYSAVMAEMIRRNAFPGINIA